MKRAAAALVLSFAVYLVPLVGPHDGWLLGTVILRELGGALSGRAARDLGWVATDLGVALAAQAVFGLLLWWFVGRPGWRRGLAVVAPVFPAIILLNHAFLVAVPMRFLIEPDTTPERAGWPLECSLRDVWIPQLRTSATAVAGPEPLWVLEVKAPYRYGLFSMPGCVVRMLELTQSANVYATQVAGDRALVVAIAPATGKQQWSVFDAASGARIPLDVGEGAAPILSRDGRAVVWLRPVADSGSPVHHEAVIHGVDGSAERVIGLGELGREGLLQLVEADTEAGELVLARGLRELFRVGVDGRPRAPLPRPEGVDPHPETVRFLPGGWIAWDGYREAESYRVAWSLGPGTGAHRVPRSRGITSLAASPDGRFVGLSVTSRLNIGSTQDAVYVLGTADGREVFRKYFPKYTRSSLAFLGPGWFAYTDLGGINVLGVR